MSTLVGIPPKPSTAPFHGLPPFPAIDALRSRDQWVAWNYVWKPEREKWDKPPINPKTGTGASHSNPEHWGSYDSAAQLAMRKSYAGVGFVLSPEDGLTGIDIDNCRHAETGALSALAAKVIALGETYAEVSPSGKGVRLFATGKVDKATKSDPAGVEVYGTQRYLTLTGQHVPGTPTDIRPAPQTLALLLDHVEKVAALVAAEKARIEKAASASTAATEPPPRPPERGSSEKNPFWKKVNTAAFESLGAWVPSLFGSDAKHQPGTGGYRITSVALGRDLQEDLSITKDGCTDFGVADQGNARGGKRTAIDLVIQFGAASDPTAAALWLCDQMFIDPESLGWNASTSASPSGQSESSAWPDPKPLPSGLLPVAAFQSDMIPAAIGPWVMDISDRMQCPPDFVAVSAMVALSAVLGRKVAIRPQARTDWTEVPNLWGCIVGRPGAMKSPAMAEAMKPLNRMEAEARAANAEALKKHVRDLEAFKIKQEAAQKAARAAVGKGEAIGSILNLDAPEKPPAKRFICNDATYEALGEILAANPNGVLAFRDELVSLLKTLDREENAAARGFFLTAWNGTSGYTFDRILRGLTHIDAACVSLLGSTQPGRIADYLSRAVKGASGDDGLIQRFSLLIWPNDTGAWKEVDRYPDSEARRNAWDTFTRLNEISGVDIGAIQSDFDKIPFFA